MKKIAIIADDLTGANDTGAQFAKQGLKTLVILQPEKLETILDYDYDVIVTNTDSRASPPAVAYQKVAAAARFIKKKDYGALYKKIDSTLRGNLGVEIDAIMDECSFKIAIIAPAFPQNGRTTINGIQLLHGIPLEATEISKDPKCPMAESDIVKIISGQTKRTIGHIGIKTMKSGLEAVREAIAQMMKKDAAIIVADIWLDEHFSVLAEAAAQNATTGSILWVGSAGLAEVLPGVLGVRPQTEVKPAKSVVVVAGSVSAVTRKQIAFLAAQPGISILEADPVKLISLKQSDEYFEEYYLEIKTNLAKGRDIVIVPASGGEFVAAAKRQGAALGIPEEKISDLIAENLGKIVKATVAENPFIGGFVLTGGDTAANICQALSAYGLKIIDEVAVGIPMGLLQGGCCHGMPVVTKAGAFGSEDSLEKAVASLKKFNLN